jgi:hypothetical protein
MSLFAGSIGDDSLNIENEASFLENSFNKMGPTPPGQRKINVNFNKSKTSAGMRTTGNRFSSTRPSADHPSTLMSPPMTADSGGRGYLRASPLSKHQGALNIS